MDAPPRIPASHTLTTLKKSLLRVARRIDKGQTLPIYSHFNQTATKELQVQLKIFSIRDSKAEYFAPPFFQQNHALAERMFRTATNDPQSQVNKYPQDFDLYYLGTYDDQTGKIQVLDSPEHVIKAIHLVDTAQNISNH